MAQPHNPATLKLALQALIACPTASIGTTDPLPEMPEARREFPIQIEGNVFYCGCHSEKSFGAASYFIQRPEGNILIASMRTLATHPFAWVLPGHGRRHFAEGDSMKAQMQQCLDWMEGNTPHYPRRP